MPASPANTPEEVEASEGGPVEVLCGYWVMPGFIPYDGHVALAIVMDDPDVSHLPLPRS